MLSPFQVGLLAACAATYEPPRDFRNLKRDLKESRGSTFRRRYGMSKHQAKMRGLDKTDFENTVMHD